MAEIAALERLPEEVFAAALEGEIATVQNWLLQGGDPDQGLDREFHDDGVVYDQGSTLLIAAASMGRIDAMRLLVSHGADVNVTAGVDFRLSLYMVGEVKPAGKPTWSFSRQAIRVMDLATLDPVAQDPLIEGGGGGGVYWSLRYNASVRLRVMPIDSDAGYSAIFFDEA